jgi:hypothetical protein
MFYAIDIKSRESDDVYVPLSGDKVTSQFYDGWSIDILFEVIWSDSQISTSAASLSSSLNGISSSQEQDVKK